MSLEEDYQRAAEKIHELGLAVTRLVRHHTSYTIYSVTKSDGVVGLPTKISQSREELRTALADSKQLLEGLIEQYPL